MSSAEISMDPAFPVLLAMLEMDEKSAISRFSVVMDSDPAFPAPADVMSIFDSPLRVISFESSTMSGPFPVTNLHSSL